MTDSFRLRFDAVLPLVRKDWQRVDRLLLPTLDAFATGLKTIWVIVRSDDYLDAVRHFSDPRLVILSELDLIPELSDSETNGLSSECNPGWWVQQLLKLAAARLVSTDWYLPIDADIVLGRQLRSWDLIRNCKLVARLDSKHHRSWYQFAERILEMPHSGRYFGVTPAPLHRQSVLDLFAFLSEKYQDDAERVLLRKFPWTEYALYYSFLEGTGRFENVHSGVKGAIYGNCVWVAGQQPILAWDPGATFGNQGPPFTVLQSTAVDLETFDLLVERIRSWFAANGQVSPI